LDTLVQAVQADVNESQKAALREVNGDMHGLEAVIEMLKGEKSDGGPTSCPIDPQLEGNPKSNQAGSGH
jgi:hypothetical protein